MIILYIYIFIAHENKKKKRFGNREINLIETPFFWSTANCII